MRKTILLLGPTLMIFIGLTLFSSVPLTFGLFYGWLFLVPLFMTIKGRNHSVWKFTISSRSVWLGVISGLFFMILIYGTVAYLFSYLIDLELIRSLLKEWNFEGKSVWLLIAVLIFLNPYFEENYWRNFMYEELKISTSTSISILVTAFFYSLYHVLSVIELFNWPFNVIAVAPIFLAGIIWGWFRLRTGSLAAPVISHVLADVGIMMIYLVYIHSW